MLCSNCGNELGPNDRFCGSCGALVQAPDSTQSSETPKKTVDLGGKLDIAGVCKDLGGKVGGCFGKLPKGGMGGKKGLIIGGVAAAVVLVVLIVVLSITGKPNVKVASALKGTLKEFQSVSNTLKLPDAAKVLQAKSASYDLDMSLSSMDEDAFGSDSEVMEGLGIRAQLDMNLSKRVVAASVAPYIGSTDLVNGFVALRNDMFYFGMPEIFPDEAYGISTVTGMADLKDLGADMGDFDDVSFNVFDLLDLIKEYQKEGEDSRKEMDAATKALIKTIEVEKTGKKNVRINGKGTKCDLYQVTIPQDDLEDWLDALEDYAGAVDYQEILEAVLKEMNLPKKTIKEISGNFTSSSVNMDGPRDLLDEIGDVEFTVAVSSSKIAQVKLEEELYDEDLEVVLSIGGGDSYVDDITLELISGDEEFIIESSGNHAAKDGKFTDKTSVAEIYKNKVRSEVVLTSTYEPKAKDDNLTIALEVDNEDILSLEGFFTADGKSMELKMDELALMEADEEFLCLSGSWTVSEYMDRTNVEGARLLSELTVDDLAAFFEETENNAADWLADMIEEVPALMYLF